MVLSHGVEEYIDNKKKLVRYKFFRDDSHGGRDAVFGLDVPLMRLMNVLKSAAQGYGTERRIILLHGPVGSAKSTIARQLKKGLEEYSRPPKAGSTRTSGRCPARWPSSPAAARCFRSPMHDEPLRLIPRDWRQQTSSTGCGSATTTTSVKIEGDVNPACRLIFKELMQHYGGNFEKVMSHVRCRRLVLSEQDRIGIGTFQPKDEKNQDSTELTGDINYRKIATFGSDSRSARVQLRRRVQHRQSRHSRVRRDLEARRRVPLRSARRDSGAQDQAEEVRADRHRRGDPRPHERGRVQEAPQQRVHGGAARSHREGRHPVHHESLRGSEDLHEGLHAAEGRQAHRAAHAVRRGAVGGADAARGSEEALALAAPEVEALRRQDAAGFHAGQHQGAAQGGAARRPRRHLAALHPGQDRQLARQRQGRRRDQPVHGAERARERPALALAHQQR